MANKDFSIVENQWIELSDGRRLAARIWLPDAARLTPVPAILEYLPYRKNDGTRQRDDSTYPGFAKAGYAGVRVDIQGNGESDGSWDDEYSPTELADGVEVINWIASQSWCDGNLGMMGISWGGFNSLQIASLQPTPLKAVIAIGTTVDRYNDDIHYKNGCLLDSNFYWSNTMLSYASRPPDPLIVGERWRDLWRQRLQTQPLPLAIWLQHQRRDDYWKHGSVGENYDDIKIPVLVISGWADGYLNAPPALARNLAQARAINGPWIHKYPHFAFPHPRMDFLGEAIQWWDRWLKQIDNAADQLPDYRAFLSEAVKPPEDRIEKVDGIWVEEKTYPSDNIRQTRYWLDGSGALSDQPPTPGERTLQSALDCGTGCGDFFTVKPDHQLPADQSADDAESLVFETEPLIETVSVLGRPVVNLRLSIDQPQGNICLRLNDVHPDGTVYRVSWGVLNLSHRGGNENPQTMQPGKLESIELELDECGYRFLPGHRIRVSLSNHYWPMIMPSPTAVTTTVAIDESTCLWLPVLQQINQCTVPEPENPNPLPDYPMHSPAEGSRTVEHDPETGETIYRVIDDSGEMEIPDHGMRIRHLYEESWRIHPDDPGSCRAQSLHIYSMRRGSWSTRTETHSELRCDETNFYLSAQLLAFENDELFNTREWPEVSIPRDHI